MRRQSFQIRWLPKLEDLLQLLEKDYKKINIVRRFFEEEDINRAQLLKEDVKNFVDLISKEGDELIPSYKRKLTEIATEKNHLHSLNQEDLKKTVEEIRKKLPKYKKKISQTQIRKHYNYFLDIYQDVEHKNWKLDGEHFVKLAMEKVYVNYDFARDNVNYLFKRFVEDLIDEIKDEETLKIAQVLFEALVGYSKVFIKN